MSYAYSPNNGIYGNITLSSPIDANYTVSIGPTSDWSLNNVYTATGTGSTGSSGKISLTGDQADIEINGQSLKQTLESINARLGVLVPNPELEKEFEELKELGERYRELEKKFSEQQKVFNILKK